MPHSETMSNRQAQSVGDPPNATVALPYIRNTSESIRRVLSTVNVRTCFKPHRILSQSLVHVKDQCPKIVGKAWFIRSDAALVICHMLVKLDGHCTSG